MHTDTFLKKGNSHEKCEDYVSSVSTTTNEIGIVSDGCSSTERSDIGARLLTLIAEKQVLTDNLHNTDLEVFGAKVLGKAEGIANSLGYIGSDAINLLSATLGVMFVNEFKAKVAFFGDGCIVIKYNDGSIEMVELEYDKNAPYYLAYKIDSYADENYQKNVKSYNGKNYIIHNGEIESQIYYSSQSKYPFDTKYNTKLVESISLCSDGIMSFVNKKKQSLDTKRLLEGLTDFKNTKGKFLKRRMNKFIKELNKDGYDHYDDISIVTVIL